MQMIDFNSSEYCSIVGVVMMIMEGEEEEEEEEEVVVVFHDAGVSVNQNVQSMVRKYRKFY